MKTKEEIRTYLHSLQWQRLSKKELVKNISDFLGEKVHCENGTDPDEKGLDFSFIMTTATEPMATCHFIDIEIYYLKMRNRNILITGSELLMYCE